MRGFAIPARKIRKFVKKKKKQSPLLESKTHSGVQVFVTTGRIRGYGFNERRSEAEDGQRKSTQRTGWET